MRQIRTMLRLLSVTGLVLAFVLTLAARPVRAATLTVNSTADTVVSGDGQCTLREALNNVAAATETTGGDCVAGTGTGDIVTFSIMGVITLTASNNWLTLPDNVTIRGPGADLLAVDGNNAIAVFTINSHVTASISDLTIQHAGGNPLGGFGGIGDFGGTLTLTDCVIAHNNTPTAGGIVNEGGTVMLVDSTVRDNVALGSIHSASHGGGIENNSGGTLTVVHSAIVNNSVGGSINYGRGGGIDNESSTLILIDSTVANNTADASQGAINGGVGGGVFTNSTATFINSTVANNTAQTGGIGPGALGGGIYFDTRYTGNIVTLTNTLVAGNSIENNGQGPDVDGYGSANASNSVFGIGDGSGLPTASNGNRAGTAASPLNSLLGPLGAYGGPTQTMPLLPGSPAIDAGDDATCVAAPVGGIDQRGISRTASGAHCDIGAFESQGFALTLVGGNNQSAPDNTPFASAFTVQVASGHGEPVQGGQVTFAAPASGASATFAGNPAPIAANGQASARALANGTPGTYTANATAAGAGAGIPFNLTNVLALTGITPIWGSPSGGTVVTLTGIGFGTPANTQVLLDGVALPSSSIAGMNGTTIIYIAPAHTSGGVTVTVRGNGVVGTGSAMYTYGTLDPSPASRPGPSPDSQSPGALPGGRPSGVLPANPNPLPPSR